MAQKGIGLQCFLQSFAGCPGAGRPVVPKRYFVATDCVQKLLGMKRHVRMLNYVSLQCILPKQNLTHTQQLASTWHEASSGSQQ